MRSVCLIALALAILCTSGCVRRTITIDSNPQGALVWLNDREIGRTPVEVDFLYYGDYDVRLAHEDAEPLLTRGIASPPMWDMIPFDFIAEVLPIEFHSRVRWMYELEPPRDDPEELRSRAQAMRRVVAESAEAGASADVDPE